VVVVAVRLSDPGGGGDWTEMKEEQHPRETDPFNFSTGFAKPNNRDHTR